MDGWIKMPLGREVGLGPGHIVLDGDPALPPPKGHSPTPNFGLYCGQTVAHLSYCWALVLFSLQPSVVVAVLQFCGSSNAISTYMDVHMQ